MERDTEPDVGHAPTGELAELLECERELAGLLEHAREEARRRVERARSEAAGAAAELEASLEGEAEQERTRIREDLRARVREIHTRARERTAAYEEVSNERVDRLADHAFRSLIGLGGRS